MCCAADCGRSPARCAGYRIPAGRRHPARRVRPLTGREVLVGRHAGAADWRQAIESAFTARDSIVQEYVEPATCPLELTDGTSTFTAHVAPVLSPMLFGDRPGGCMARYYATPKPEAGGVVSVSAYGASENAVLTWG
ncbi:hypothetical protein AB0D12_03060 [Streptomyces sp. NPDC048479]|uniref:hypothetical protein n=1 Tax=Streptomyces sp. NPDC048479 TaxID=3154725 RepID=UPI003415FB10